jgi:hypothetical protein
VLQIQLRGPIVYVRSSNALGPPYRVRARLFQEFDIQFTSSNQVWAIKEKTNSEQFPSTSLSPTAITYGASAMAAALRSAPFTVLNSNVTWTNSSASQQGKGGRRSSALVLSSVSLRTNDGQQWRRCDSDRGSLYFDLSLHLRKLFFRC